MKRSKRSPAVTMGLIGLSAFTLAGCKTEGDQSAGDTVFKSAAECKASITASSTYTAADCDTAYAQAQAEAGKGGFTTRAECEAEFGPEKCVETPQTATNEGGAGSLFMPLLTGFILGKMMSGGGFMSSPVFQNSSGQTVQRNGASTFAPTAGAAASPSAGGANKSSGTAATNVNRGGFGSHAMGAAS